MKCDHHDGNGCKLELFGGDPSPGVCQVCDEYSGPPRGAGDIVHTVAKTLRIDKLAARVTRGRGCGCSKRRAALNDSMPFEKSKDIL